MGLAIGFSSNSYKTSSRVEEYSLETGVDKSKIDTSPNPNPFRFTIKEQYYYDNVAILLVNYPDCTTFNGDKILLVDRFKLRDFHKKKLDPHFLDDESHPIIARFKPTNNGMRMAKACARDVASKPGIYHKL